MPHPFLIRPLRPIPVERQGERWIVHPHPLGGLPVEYLASLGGEPAMGLQPLVPFSLGYSPIADDTPIRLSPHAVQRRHGADLVWEDVAVPAQIRTYGHLAHRIWPILAPGTSAASLGRQAGLDPTEARQCLELLLCAGVARVEGEGRSARSMWSAREAWLHAQTAFGRSDRPLGGTFPYRDEMPAPTARMAAPAAPSIRLPWAELPALTLQEALQRRRSRRAGRKALDLDRLASLLHHAARVTGFEPAGEYEVRRHAYPTGGGMGELEVYALIAGCEGIDAGLFRYDPFEHGLARLEPVEADLEQLKAHASAATGTPGQHDAILFVTARMTRTFWKYEGIGYTLTLRNVGALIQTVGLVATALDIAACPLGLLPAQLFAALSGTDPWEQALVGGIALNG